MTATDRSARLSGALLVAAGAIGFSGKAVIIKLAYRHGVDALTLLALRMLLSAPLFAVLGWWAARGADPVAPRDRWAVAFMGFVGYYLASYFDFLGLQYVTAALERLLLFVNPTFVVLISAALFGRRVTGRDVIAIASCYAGIFLAFFNDLHTQPGNVVLGSAWVLLSALLYATYLVGSGRLVGRVGSMRFASYAGLVSCGAVLAHFLVASPDASVILHQPAPVYWLSLLMALASTVLPIVLTSEGIRRMGASHASIIGSVGPIATIALGAVFLGEPVTIIQIAGAAFVLLGVLAISLARK
ncbi:MAG TPA: DMT family transporter [Usitatibacter sp.]|nr:DMT family transporter [Usitatibacter sp.]